MRRDGGRVRAAAALALTLGLGSVGAVRPGAHDTSRGDPGAGRRPRALAGVVAPPESVLVVLLGTGTPAPDPRREGPATAVVVGDRVFLFDAGVNVTRQLRGAGLPANRLAGVFFTHLHSDHTLGYPDLLITSWIAGRRAPFRVYGPHGTRRMTDLLLAAYSEDLELRTLGLEREWPGGYRVTVSEIAPGVVYDSAGVRITAFAVPHGSWREAFGYRVDAPGRSVVISGDTRASDAVERAARGADVLVHETYPAARLAPEKRPGGDLWPRYMKEFHTSDAELGALAARAEPKLLLLTHVVWMGGTEDELVRGIRAAGFTGRIEVGHDLGRY